LGSGTQEGSLIQECCKRRGIKVVNILDRVGSVEKGFRRKRRSDETTLAVEDSIINLTSST